MKKDKCFGPHSLKRHCTRFSFYYLNNACIYYIYIFFAKIMGIELNTIEYTVGPSLSRVGLLDAICGI